MQTQPPDETHCAGYEIRRELALGIYSTVYEATPTDPNLAGRTVALKVLRHRGYAQHFLRAVEIKAFLEHPNIPAPCEVGEVAGWLYTARMFVAGDDLQNGIRSANRSISEVTAIVVSIAAALDYAHGRGVVHGSVHPRHILLEESGTPWLIGFGEYPPHDSLALGNPLHLAPEQLEGDGRAAPASDVFALAETAWWLLCGRHPFEGLRPAELLAAKRAEQFRRPIRELLPGILPAVEQVLQRGIAGSPARRHATAGEFAAALASAEKAGASPRRWRFWR